MDTVKILRTLGIYRYAQSFRNRRRRPRRLSFYSQFVGYGDLCFDIGANVGNRTDIFARLGARVVAVEPQPEPFDYLRKHYDKNKNVILIQKAIGSKEGTAAMSLCYADGSSSMSEEWIKQVKKSGRFPKSYNWDRQITIPVTTLDNLILSYGMPSFCKIDVEGFEAEVISGLSKPIGLISFEYTPEVITTTISVIDYLKKLGDYQFNYVEGEDTKFALQKWVSVDEISKHFEGLKPEGTFGDVYAQKS